MMLTTRGAIVAMIFVFLAWGFCGWLESAGL